MNHSFHSLTPKLVVISATLGVIAIGLYVILTSQSSENTLSSTQNTQQVAEQVVDEEAATSQATTSEPSTQVSSTETAQDTQTKASSTYQNGTYTEEATYSVPKGEQNSLTLSITIENDVITNVSTDNDYGDHESGQYISSFESKLSGAVVGKKLDSTFSSRIGGASLTTQAFKNAIAKVKQSAA